MASQDWLEKDFYAILGVSKDASDAEIKKVYRKLARENHPDSNPGDSKAEQRFKEISEAYSVLSDAETRAEYDQIRAMAQGGPRFTAGGGGASGFEDIFGGMFGGGSPRGGPAGFGGGLFDGLFDGGMGQGGPGGYPRYREPTKGQDVQARITLDLATAVEGTTVSVEAAAGKKVSAKIPAGVKDGQKVRLRGKGRPSPDGGKAGDVIITVGIPKHAVFSREEQHLRVVVPVTFKEASLGDTIEVPTLSGETVKVKVPPGTQSGQVMRVRGRGVTSSAGIGDLLVEIRVAVPSHLSKTAKAHLDKLFEALPQENPRDDLIAKAKR
ncbi:DnaJ C-terminal domain-containing protein [Pontimonas sp.]|uniref:DnaJ C-terminal domain-containing protein n=1 Tax=Pontimonas sp. TaxID=2304492 RepID=UPI0028700F33|nr:DnaJ C-terminal domain-containing protein [Pontimonas sp.]MDR9396367.1 DnaJ C-terminal domain-containing protein [Pontimonas sp.]